MRKNLIKDHGNGGQWSPKTRYISNPDYSAIINSYKSEWITAGANREFVVFAEKTGKALAEGKLTKSKIRSIYGEIKRIQAGGFEKMKSSFYLLKPKVAYALGRDEFNKGLQLFKQVFDKCYPDVNDEHSYENFCNFFEAILAYHKAFGGKD